MYNINKPTFIFVDMGCVQDVLNPPPDCFVVDFDILEGDNVCPVCHAEDIPDTWICPDCKIDWNNRPSYEQIIRIAGEHYGFEIQQAKEIILEAKEIILESLLTYLREAEEECFCEDNGGSCAKCLIERFDELGGL